MQYILTEAEYEELEKRAETILKRERAKRYEACKASGLCTLSDGLAYCDDCRLRKFCPYEYKEFSK